MSHGGLLTFEAFKRSFRATRSCFDSKKSIETKPLWTYLGRPPRTPLTVLTGETTRTLDERYRLTLPTDLVEALLHGSDPKQEAARSEGPSTRSDCLLAKERSGSLSLWNRSEWETKQNQTTELVRNKLLSGRLDQRLTDVQRLGRLLSTRQRIVPLAGRGRLVIPEGFRELLGVDPGGSVIVVGAAVCVELWHPDAWAAMISEQMPSFRELFENLAN